MTHSDISNDTMIGTCGERPSLFTGQPSHEQKSVLPCPSPILFMIKKSLDVYSLPTKQELILISLKQLLNNKLTMFIKLLTDKITKTIYFKQVQGGSPEGYMIIGFLSCVITWLENLMEILAMYNYSNNSFGE